jgi:hypothetical protein
MSREVRVIVVYEDVAHSKFARQLVRKLGLKPVRFVPQGDCHAVLTQYGVELESMRPAMTSQKGLGLVILVDADGKGLPDGGLAERKRSLERITEAHGGARQPEERIAWLIPALEIEAWYLHLCDPSVRPVDEGADYKPDPRWKALAADLAGTAQRAVAAWHPEPGRVDPPSMEDARAELKRLR